MYLVYGNMPYMPWEFVLFWRNRVTQKTTDEIRELLIKAKLDFESVENEALNAYLPRIFHICPFSEEVCTKKQCIDCAVLKKMDKK
jgi:hypothetical protein